MTALRAFESVCRLQNFKDASSELNVTPSAVSHQIRRLEKELGCRLMNRGRSGFDLTAEGLKFSVEVSRALRSISDAASEISEGGSRRVTLQVYSTFAVRWLLPRLPRLKAEHDSIELGIVTSQDDIDLSTGAADACVMIGEPSENKVDYTYLFSSTVYPVCSPEYLSRNPGLKRPSDLSDHTLLQVYPSQGDWDVWLEAVGAGEVDSAGDSRFDSYDHALDSAAKGLGVALAIDPFANEDLAEGRLVEVFSGLHVRHPANWYFSTLDARKNEPKIAVLREWLTLASADLRKDEHEAAIADAR
ncbi:LysR substrate-binding domain-containing protein [Henriciella sp. AS95]|uniref:LysR substrate-binding domain-containing protein n=1 Tax=Henriciella sp. AS95 TaxID=3135782 RepID=UPI00316B82A7